MTSGSEKKRLLCSIGERRILFSFIHRYRVGPQLSVGKVGLDSFLPLYMRQVFGDILSPILEVVQASNIFPKMFHTVSCTVFSCTNAGRNQLLRLVCTGYLQPYIRPYGGEGECCVGGPPIL